MKQLSSKAAKRAASPSFAHPEEHDDNELLLSVSGGSQRAIGIEEGDEEAGQPGRARGDLLEALVGPVGKERFLSEFWERRALVVRGGGRGRLDRASMEEYLLELDVAALLEASPSEQIHVWLSSRDGRPSESFRAEPETAMQCYRTGNASLYFRAPQPLIDALVSSMGMALGAQFGSWGPDGSLKGEIETFLGRKGNVTEYHFDFQ